MTNPIMQHLTIGGTTYDTVGAASVTQVVSSGTKIATVTIDGTNTDLYAPSGGSSVEPATATPLVDGTAAVGSSAKYAREDHVHPTDTSRQAALVSGTNIKTVNNESLLGSGNIDTSYTLPTASTSTLGGVKVDGSTVTIDGNGVISAAGGGGGGVNKLTLYGNNYSVGDITNLWVDKTRTTTLFEYFDSDYHEAETAMASYDIIEVYCAQYSKCFSVVGWEVDPIDETFWVMIPTGTTNAQYGQSIPVFKKIDINQ